ncbi:MAG TPA: transglutaminase-like domain-containing protein [Opitutaceae bacterium]|nr:transglutaminase-like domain-containing protein [Opitutaceae bacterium]
MPKPCRAFLFPWRLCVGLVFAAFLLSGRLDAVTMRSLLEDPKMTPQRFAALFEKFEFELHPFDVQNPDQFLASQSGDCIDYAVLADHVLSRKGYWTRLIRVEMVGKNMGHAVCYVTESRAYLDYNNRKYVFNLERSGARIRQIAAKVADSLEGNWTFAQEFTYDYSTAIKRAVVTIVKTAPPAQDYDVVHPAVRPKARE